MTHQDRISSAALQDRAFAIAEARVMGLLQAKSAGWKSLTEACADLAPLGTIWTAVLFDRFRLSALQQDIFLLAAAPDLGIGAAAALAEHPLSAQGRATPALMTALLGPEARSEVMPSSLLRLSHLIEARPQATSVDRPIYVPETVLSYIAGTPTPDPALLPVLTQIMPTQASAQDQAVADAILSARNFSPTPLVHLETVDGHLAERTAAAALGSLSLAAFALSGEALPMPAEHLARLLNRDLVLLGGGLIAPATSEGVAVADRVTAPCLVWGTAMSGSRRPVARFPLKPTPEQYSTEERKVQGLFNLSPAQMRDASASVALKCAPSLWTEAKTRAARGLDGLAERMVPQAGWDDLVLPQAQMDQLRQLTAFRTHRDQVFDAWGFRDRSARGLGLSALFSGPSGTGKTMAAEIVARDLGPGPDCLELYRVDLSAIVSKYIGETEKNIARIFDAAENAGAVLIFDEGEALFGKRTSDVKDSLDRHSNTETAYLLQRLEAYSGIAIVTTNLKTTVDEAFLRRFRAVVDFPFPDAALRETIWRVIFPRETPLEDLNYAALGRLAITGGFIRSIALTAAFLAAEAGTPVTMAHLKLAVRQEYGKLGKPLSEAELRGFS